MTSRRAAFAIPGDITTLTGGYIYERLLLENLRLLGRDVAHIQLGAGFPQPTPTEMSEALAALEALDPTNPLILDGLVFGSIDPEGLRRVRAPVIAMVHHPLALETGLEPKQRAYLFETERDNLETAAHVLVPSPHTAEILQAKYSVPTRKITIARPGSRVAPAPPAPADPPVILSVGIQHPRKGHDVLLRALASLKAISWRAVIVGSAFDSAHAAELAQLQERLGLSDRVRFAGRLSQERLDDLYRQASIFALATRYEGYGIVFDEAMRWGLPVVSCATGAVPDTVPKGAGLLVPPDAPEAFAAALDTLLEASGRRAEMAQAARAAGRALPSWADTAGIAEKVLAQFSEDASHD